MIVTRYIYILRGNEELENCLEKPIDNGGKQCYYYARPRAISSVG
jgi:hypothetical protein